MATKRLSLFWTEAEFAELFDAAVTSLDLRMFRLGPGPRPEVSDLSSVAYIYAEGEPRARVLLGPPDVAVGDIDTMHMDIARVGMLLIVPPRTDGRVLYMGEIAGKTVWFDRESGAQRTNNSVSRLFGQLKSRFLEQSVCGVVGRNIKTGASHSYSDILCSGGAKEFAATGGELMQEGVGNVRFVPNLIATGK